MAKPVKRTLLLEALSLLVGQHMNDTKGHKSYRERETALAPRLQTGGPTRTYKTPPEAEFEL